MSRNLKYYDLLVITPWGEYKALDKFKKITAFTIEGIEDKNVLQEIYERNLIGDVSLTSETKKKIKNAGLLLKSVGMRVNRYRHILHLIQRYWDMKILPASQYWRISVLLEGQNSEESKLHNIIEHRDHELFNTLYPPNFFYDTTNVSAYNKNQIVKKFPTYKTFSDISFQPSSDFDFNIPEYLYKRFGVKE